MLIILNNNISTNNNKNINEIRIYYEELMLILQVDLIITHKITAIQVAGFANSYLKSFKIALSNTSIEWAFHQHNGSDKVTP